jgi:hypothetical protein
MTSANLVPGAAPHSPLRVAVAGEFLQALAAQDFASLALALRDDVRLRALLPGGFHEWAGAARVTAKFAQWLGDTEQFSLVESAAGEIGGRLYLRWRARLRAERLGDGPFLVEQHAYADLDDAGRVSDIWLACSGYQPEHRAG